ncbi:cyclic nucleotide-binding domain-containing protein [Myxococcota bacterium]|nr:cyclic nucleotide-binding domain-containing protein [Myxococcota bacterium]
MTPASVLAPSLPRGLLEETAHAPGEHVAREGKPLGALCVVASGELVVSKRDPEGAEHVLARLGPGEIFGELSFVDAAPASATITAIEPTTVLRLPRSNLALCPPHARAELERTITRATVERLRTLGGDFARAQQAQREEARVRHHLERFVLMLVALFGLGQLVARLITPGLAPALHMAYSWGFLLLIVALVVGFMHRHDSAPADFGLTLDGGLRSGVEGTLFGVALAGVVIGGRAASMSPGDVLFTWGSVAAYPPALSATFFAAYPLHCFLQELVARGAIQGSLERMLRRHARAGATLVTAVLFGIFHLHVSIGFAIVTFAASLVFGAIYARHRTLLGVTITHTIVGLASVAAGLN